MAWNWVCTTMQYCKNQSAIKICSCHMWLLHTLQILLWLFGLNSFSFKLPKGHGQQSSMIPACSRTEALRRKISLKVVEVTTRQKLASKWKCIFTRHIVNVQGFLRVWGEKKIDFQLSADPTPFPIGSTIHQHLVSITVVQNCRKKRKEDCS